MIKLGYKQQSSLFEWQWTDTMTEINFVVEKLVNKEPITITRNNGNDYIDGTKIVTGHYQNQNYREIFDRRAARFLEQVRCDTPILFIRDDIFGNITADEINKFKDILHTINPDCSYKIIIVSPADKYTKINSDKVFHEVYDLNKYEDYINSCMPLYKQATPHTSDKD